MISAEIIADSKNSFGDRLTTYVLRFPRIILAEINTHRILSKNSASSRAVPFERMLKMVEENPFIPIKWMKEHKGMQGTEYFNDLEVEENLLLSNWLLTRDNAIKMATNLSQQGLTKQVVNRLLEPFMWHTAIITGSNWENFFALRAHDAAEIHLQDLAYKMLDEYNKSTPKQLKIGEWHIPFGDKMDESKIMDILLQTWKGISHPTLEEMHDDFEKIKLKISIARCARVSYLNFDGKDDYNADVKLHDRLLLSTPLHASPAEHAGRSMTQEEYDAHTKRYPIYDIHGNIIDIVTERGWSRNIKGFVQYRSLLPFDTAKDIRVIQK